MRIDVHGARLIARVDDSQEEVYLKGLNHDTNYGVSTNLPSVVLVGGRYTINFILFHILLQKKNFYTPKCHKTHYKTPFCCWLDTVYICKSTIVGNM